MAAWWLDELAHAGPEHLDAQYVAGYDAKAGYEPDDDLDVLRRHGLGSTSTIIDLGAGTGRFSIQAAAWCQQVIAVDVSPAMVAALRQRVHDLGLSNVTWCKPDSSRTSTSDLQSTSCSAATRSINYPTSGRASLWPASPR